MRIQEKQKALEQEVIANLCAIPKMPENMLPHTVYVEEEGEDGYGHGIPVYTMYRLEEIRTDGSCTLYNAESRERFTCRHLHEINMDWLVTVWERYLELCVEQDIWKGNAVAFLKDRTGKPEEDGLGFSHKWNMGWMNDFLEYMKLDPYFRKWNHHKMTFSMTYAYAEKYILMPGLYDDKFANLRAGYAYMLGHPGKKLLFMGQEFAQLQEWSEARELDWYLLAEEKHQQMQNYVKALLHLYKKTPALYDADLCVIQKTERVICSL